MRSLLAWAVIVAAQYVVFVWLVKPQLMRLFSSLVEISAALGRFTRW